MVTSRFAKGGLRVGWCQGNVTKGGLPLFKGGLRVGRLFCYSEKGGLGRPITRLKGGLGSASDNNYPRHSSSDNPDA